MEIEFLKEQLVFVCDLLNNNNINYYVVGALGAYIDANIPIMRKHDDIDIMILEKDVIKLKKIFDNSNYIFYDNRFKSDKILNEYGYTDGDHEVYAQYKYNDFHIGFFLFDKDDEYYSIIEYFKENGIQKRLIRKLPLRYLKYQYNETKTKYLGVNIKTVTKECIYKNKKNMNRDKDIFDIKNLEKYINYEKLNNLSGMSKERISIIENV